MYYNYYYDFDDLFNLPFSHSAAGALGAFAVLFILVYLLILAYGILSYVLTSLGFYTMAKRRGIRNYGLAWVPVANMWIIGGLADQYDLAIKGRETGRRRKLLILSIISAAGALLLFAVAFTGGMVAVFSQSRGAAAGGLTVFLLLFLALLVLEVVLYVFYYIALYKVFMSCNPGTATTFLVLAIVINATLPFFIFADRNKDLGFPLRPADPAPQEPAPAPEIPAMPAAAAPAEPAQPDEPADNVPEAPETPAQPETPAESSASAPAETPDEPDAGSTPDA